MAPAAGDNHSAAPTHARTKNGTLRVMQAEPIIDVAFFRTESGTEPVRDWLKSEKTPTDDLALARRRRTQLTP